MSKVDRRDFMKLAGLGGVVFAAGLGFDAVGMTQKRGKQKSLPQDFYFVQLSDTHWGFDGPKANPDAQGTLKKAVAAVNSLDEQPDFVVFTGDLTHTTDDPKVRRARMAEFKEIVSQLKVKTVRFMPGEHDASLDRGEAYQEFFGDLHYTFDHKGVHFIVLDNVSDPEAVVGEAQFAWLQADLKQHQPDTPIVVLTHRPLFDLYPQWDWATRDAAAVIDALMPYKNVTVFYGHIHQEHHHLTGHIAHHAAKSLIFPLPPPGSVPKRAPVLWDPATPYKGLGFRNVEAAVKRAKYEITEHAITKG
ncbi:MAG: metallophosphoesterase [Acidobacteria bacterium]|nr:metallophosphoesterase [Acidobacteriota bacterium]MBI3423242.1 metallophosphoesterase [Acidobacteriota bacterium]